MPGPISAAQLSARARAWLERWRPLLPLFAAEFVIWVGLGGLLPVMPLYFTARGADVATLGVIVAAWPAARLVGEPVFGWLADRTRRVPLMVVGLVATAVCTVLLLAAEGAAAFVALRALTGLAAALYDPAARGYMTDATPRERHGEAFGLYSAAQMGGLLFGPAIGGLGAALVGSVTFVFWFGAAGAAIAAVVLALAMREEAPGRAHAGGHAAALVEFPAAAAPEAAGASFGAVGAAVAPPDRLLNRRLLAAIAVFVGANFAYGAYEVVWSLYLEWRGAGLDLIGLTFAMFGLPVLLISPFAGRLVDRSGTVAPLVAGSVVVAATGALYPLVEEPVLVIPLILAEGTATAVLSPALYAIVAAGSPAGRSSTAQGLFGAAGTAGFIVAALVTGALASADLRYPFYVFSVVMVAALVIGLAIGRDALPRGSRAGTAEGSPAAPGFG